MMPRWVARAVASFSPAGLLLGTLSFAASLTPSLIPRDTLMQGALSGISLSIGYGVGAALQMLWHYLELPRLKSRPFRILSLATILVCVAIAIYFLFSASAWQNSIRSLMGMEPVEAVRPVEVAIIALVVFVVLILIARLFALIF